MDFPQNQIDKIKAILEIIAVIAGGIWAIFMYIKFENFQHSLELTQKSIDIVKSKSEIKKTELEIRKEQAELDKLNHTPVSITQDIKISKLDKKHYAIDYHYALTNQTSRPIFVTSVSLQALVLPEIKQDKLEFFEIPVLKPLGQSVNYWRPIISKTYYTPGAPQNDEFIKLTLDKNNKEFENIEGESILGDVQPNITNNASLSLAVSKDKYSYVGFRVKIEFLWKQKNSEKDEDEFGAKEFEMYSQLVIDSNKQD